MNKENFKKIKELTGELEVANSELIRIKTIKVKNKRYISIEGSNYYLGVECVKDVLIKTEEILNNKILRIVFELKELGYEVGFC